MKAIKANVLTLATAMPSLIEHENELLHAYWVLFDKIERPDQIIRATPAGTISRRLRELQNEGLVARIGRETGEPRKLVSEFSALN